MTFIDEKGLLKSKAVLGAVLAAVPAAISGLDWLVGTGVLPPNVALGISAIGGALAFLGRVGAKAKIKGWL